MKRNLPKILIFALFACLLLGTFVTAVNSPERLSGISPSSIIRTLFGTSSDATPTDATSTDATPTDATPTDATPTDATPTDATPTDATPTDATPTDATPTDATPSDGEASHNFVYSGNNAYGNVCAKIYKCTVCGEEKIILEHEWKLSAALKEPTCAEYGMELYKCEYCDAEKTRKTDPTGDHTWKEAEIISEPTCISNGVTKYICTECNSEKTEITEKTDIHKWDKGTVTEEPGMLKTGELKYSCMYCTQTRSAVLPLEQWKNGKTFEYGSYPQSSVTDENILAELNEKTVDTDWNTEWVSFGFYSGNNSANGEMAPGDFMKYIDVTLNGNKYRAVKFTDYRPYSTPLSTGAENSRQQENGFVTDTVYWFSYDPLVWKVLDAEKKLVICESVIDAQSFCNTIFFNETDNEAYIASDSDVYTVNYASSSIREWLNNDFAQTAFTENELEKISITLLDNSAYSEKYSKYDAPETEDGIFLLSYSDLKNEKYFSSNSESTAKTTAYSLCMGVAAESGGYASSWILRSPGINSYTVSIAKYSGKTDSAYVTNTYNAGAGIRPGFCVDTVKFLPDVLNGDIDGDGDVTSADARLALRNSVGLEPLFDLSIIAADADRSGVVEPADARLILRAAVGLEEI